ncbi:MAG: EAL domain-containing protein, partial [Candidatus Limnocylindrales bacterium]
HASEMAALDTGFRYEMEYRGIRPDGTIRVIHDQAEVIRDEAGTPIRMVGTVQDITERVAAEADRSTLAAAVEQTADAVWIKDLDGVIIYANLAFSHIYGYEPKEVVGRFAGIVNSGRHEEPFFDAIWEQARAGKTWIGTIMNRRKDGEIVELESVISGIRDSFGRTVSFMQTDRDVTRERALEHTISRLARERSLIEAAVAAIDSESTPETIADVACGEMIRMPVVDAAFVIGINPYGHGVVLGVAGSISVIFASSRILPPGRASYLFDRASAGTWTEEWQARPEDGVYGERISATGLRTVAYAPLRGPNGVIGVVGMGVNNSDREAFLEQLPLLTTLGSILGSLIAPGLEARFGEHAARARTQGILDGAAFKPFFQAIVELRTGTVVGYEALSRFDDGVPPDITFALAVRCGLGIELEAATIRAAIDASANLPPDAYLSLNVSPMLIASGGLGGLIVGALRTIVLEITEHEAIEDYSTLRGTLAGFGPTVLVAVDDAGAGYASLRHILELAPAYVKLDIRLIRGIDADPARQALIAGVGYFAMKRKLRLIAEGVETAEELQSLLDLGVHLGQGYLLGRPRDGTSQDPWPTKISLPATKHPRDATRS